MPIADTPPNQPVLRDNRWEPAPDELAAFFGIGQLKGIFTKSLHVPLGARAVVLQDGRIEEVPCGTYEVEGFFSRLANLLRDRPAEILITRESALLIPLQFDGILTAEFLGLEASLTVGVKTGDIAAFAGQFMGRSGQIRAEQLRELLSPAVGQALAEFAGAYSLRELAANVALRGAIEARVLGNPGLKATMAGLGLDLVQVSQVALKHAKYGANRTLQGELWLVADEMKVRQEHKKHLDELYSEAEWAEIERESGEVKRRLRRQQMQAEEGVDSARLVQQSREHMQALRERDLELLDRLLKSQTREQALNMGAREQVQILEHELAERKLLREEAADQWAQVQQLARMRREAEVNVSKIQTDRQIQEQTLLAQHTRRLQEIRNDQEQARLLEDGDARRAEVERTQQRLDEEFRRGRDLTESHHQQAIQALKLEQAARLAVFRRQQRWEDVQAATQELDTKRKSALDDSRTADEIARIHGNRAQDQAQFALSRWKELQTTKLSLAQQQQFQQLEMEIKRKELAEQQADREMQRELIRIREAASIELERHAQELRKQAAEQEFQLSRVREIGKLDISGKIATTDAANAELLVRQELNKQFSGMTAAQILASQAATSAATAQAAAESAKAEAASNSAGRVDLLEAIRLRDEAQEKERQYQAALLEKQRAHEQELIRQRDNSAAQLIGHMTSLGVGVAGAQGNTGQPHVIVPPVVTGMVSPAPHYYGPAGAMPRPPCELCHTNTADARFCTHCGRQLRV